MKCDKILSLIAVFSLIAVQQYTLSNDGRNRHIYGTTNTFLTFLRVHLLINCIVCVSSIKTPSVVSKN